MSDKNSTSKTNPGHAPSWYAHSANDKTVRPSLEGALEADVCVIGAGFTGVSAALQLAENGYKVIVLEGERVGFGAEGRVVFAAAAQAGVMRVRVKGTSRPAATGMARTL